MAEITETKVSCALKKWAREKGYETKADIYKALGLPKSTVTDWLCGRKAPQIPEVRAKLFQLTGDPIFQGSLTVQKKKESLEPPEAVKVETRDYQLKVERINHLIAALLPDLADIMKAPAPIRQQVRAILGKNMELFLNSARALNSETTYQIMEKEGLIQKLIQESVNVE